jgi:hypothetical protein
LEKFLAEKIASDCGDEAHVGAVLLEVVGDIKRCTSGKESLGQEVPEAFAKAKDARSGGGGGHGGGGAESFLGVCGLRV